MRQSPFIAHLLDLLAGLGAVQVRRMFGCFALYCDGTIFALVIDDALHLKVDDVTRPGYLAAGLVPVTYTGRHGEVALPYWSVPETLLEDPAALREWAAAAVAASRRVAAARAPVKRRRRTPIKGGQTWTR